MKKTSTESESEPIYRRSKRAKYYVYDRTTKKSNLLFGFKVQEPKFSPDGSKVAFVYKTHEKCLLLCNWDFVEF